MEIDTNQEKKIEENSFLDLYAKISDTPPPEVRQLKSGKKIQNDDLKELAVGVVKRAFSECPNYELLAEALLSQPLHSIGKVCSLVTGIPVAPMLAKPTKEIGEVLSRLNSTMLPHVIESSKKPINYNVGDPLYPDHWFQPAIVWELQAADLSKSSVHRGGYNSGKLGGRGIGLRFPRYIRDRDDKKPENATNSDQITDMYLSQPEVGGDNDNNGNNDNDDYDDDLI